MKPVAAKPNLRNHQRVDVTTEVTIANADGSSVDCEISNISRTGLMVMCDQKAIKTLVPGQKTPAPGNWIYVTTTFAVPVIAQQPVSVVAGGNIVHMRRIARDRFQLGIQFAEFEGNGFEYVNNYVSKLLSNFAH